MGAAGRLASVDLGRGLIMALMALDHARMFITRSHPGEFWGVVLPVYHGDAVAFLTRLVTHLCAPSFCFLMGLGMALLVQRRAEAEGWGRGRIARHFLVRGGLLMVLQHVAENPAWLLGQLGATIPVEHYGVDAIPGAGGPELWLHFGVLWMLGAVMALWGLLAWLPTAGVLALSAAALALPSLLLPDPAAAHEAQGAALNLLAVAGRSGVLQVYYPLLPWFGVAGLGLAFGRWLGRDPDRAWRGLAGAGALALVSFVAARALGVLDHHPVGEGWIGWLNVTKYPASPAYLLLTLGVSWLGLGALSRLRTPHHDHPLLILGQTALGFYLLHLYLYAAVGFAFPQGTSFAVMGLVWLAGLLPLTLASHRWRRFKASKPADSLWRLF